MPLLVSDKLAKAGFLHAFPTRDATDAELLAALGAQRVVQAKQVHGARAVLAEDAPGQAAWITPHELPKVAQEADALVARAPGVAVGVRVADCVPVLVADEASGAVAAIHAGWRGVVAGVVRAGVELLGGGAQEGAPREGAPPRGSWVAAIGPCIGACCFEVGADVGEHLGFIVRREGDKAYVDLRAAVRAQLRALGLGDDRIEDVAGCTKHEPERFHSFRRDGANSGRMLASVVARGG
jgi:YfiH family protein